MAKVSVIIPLYNKEKYIKEALQSVVDQTYNDIEILVLNDGSTDNSKQIVLDFIKNYPEIIFINQDENRGVCKARNKLIDMAKGEYILPFDADDILDKTYIEKCVKVFDENPDCSVVYCNVHYFQDENKDIICNFDHEQIIWQNFIVSGSMFKKADFHSVGGYKEWLNEIGCEDWELWISFSEKGFKFYKINEVLYHYRKLKNENCMTNVLRKNLEKIHLLIFKYHIETYLKNKTFVEIVFDKNFLGFKKIKKRAIKYKKLFNYLLLAVAGELLLLVGLIFYVIYLLKSLGGGLNESNSIVNRRIRLHRLSHMPAFI